MLKTKITVLGAGAWGQAITSLLCENNNLTNNYQITLWCHETKIITDLVKCPQLEITPDLNSALENCEFLFVAIPVKYLREIFSKLKNIINFKTKIILLSKGIEQASLLFSSEIAHAILGPEIKLVVLSGPSFAHDLIAKQPTAVIIAATNLIFAQAVKNLFELSPNPANTSPTNTNYKNKNYFHVQISPDILGVQICAAYKNITALGAGILHGAGYRDNTHAYFLTQSLQELNLLVYSHSNSQNNHTQTNHTHAQSEIARSRATNTVYGLAGVGDLILTAGSTKSRNFQVGAKLGAGIKLSEIVSHPELANCEALNTLLAINLLAQKLNLNLPIAQAIYQAVYTDRSIDQTIDQILDALKISQTIV